MPALPLAEAVQQAQDAIGGGDYRRAIETCRRVLHSYPDCVTAHRLLGEAYLEQRDEAAAERAFNAALQRDPQCVSAYVGLGLIAEARRDVDTALAYFQAAWEIAPARGDLRERVVQLARDTYGPEGRLQLTRAALGSLHYHAGRWGRAVNECAAVLAEYPARVDVRLRLAEALWRRGEWDRAAATCRAVLEQAPGAVGALLLLADIERRLGHDDAAAALRERALAVDPEGARAAELLAPAPDRVDYFMPAEPPMVEEVDEPLVEAERPRIGPAPDFTAPEPEAIQTAPPADPTGVPEAPAPVEHAAADDPFDVALPTDQELEAARPDTVSTAGFTGLLRSLEDSGIEPFDAGDFGDTEAELPPWVMEPVEPEPTTPAAAEPPVAEPPAAEADTAADIAADTSADEPDLTELLGISSDQEIEAARPDDGPLSGYTGILRSIEDTGLSPFDLGDPETPEVAKPDPGLEADDLVEQIEAIAAADAADGAEDAEVDGAQAADVLAGDWDSIDQEIREAIPGEMPRGYTDELRSLDAAGVEPFSFDDEEIPFFQRMRRDETLPIEDALVDAEAPDVLDVSMPAEEEAEATDELEEASVMLLEEADLAALDVDAEPAPADTVVDEAPAEPEAERVDDAETVSDAIERLGVDADLVERARAAKESLIEAGRIAGDQPLEPPSAVEPEPEPELVEPEPVGVDLSALEEAVRQVPESSAARLALADALVAAGQGEAALEHYQWLYRHAPDESEAVIRGLTRITETAPEAAAATHRLLGAIYRKRGEVHLASRHYGLAVSLSQGQRGGRRG